MQKGCQRGRKLSGLRQAVLAPVVVTELLSDPVIHDISRFRRIVNKAFTLRRIESLTPWITGIANELLDGLSSGENELVQSYTVPLPVRVIET